MANKKNDLTQFTYEQALAELEAIVSSLESNQLPLQEAMNLFSRGQALVQHCTGLLDQAAALQARATRQASEGRMSELAAESTAVVLQMTQAAATEAYFLPKNQT